MLECPRIDLTSSMSAFLSMSLDATVCLGRWKVRPVMPARLHAPTHADLIVVTGPPVFGFWNTSGFGIAEGSQPFRPLEEVLVHGEFERLAALCPLYLESLLIEVDELPLGAQHFVRTKTGIQNDENHRARSWARGAQKGLVFLLADNTVTDTIPLRVLLDLPCRGSCHRQFPRRA